MSKKVTIKSPSEIEIMKEAGCILAEIVRELSTQVVIGNTSLEIDKYANFLCKRYKVKPAFLGYSGFKGTICANLNDIIVHGVPNNTKFRSGDIFGLDMGVILHGYYSDMSTTIEIGEVSKSIHQFIEKTKKSMENGIKKAVIGNRIGDICVGMYEGLVGEDFSLMEDFVGHGIGTELHEAPMIPGFGMTKNEGIRIEEGMCFAVESISVLGPSNDYAISKSDGWTVRTKKGELSALFENTIVVTKDGPIVLTSSRN